MVPELDGDSKMTHPYKLFEADFVAQLIQYVKNEDRCVHLFILSFKFVL